MLTCWYRHVKAKETCGTGRIFYCGCCFRRWLWLCYVVLLGLGCIVYRTSGPGLDLVREYRVSAVCSCGLSDSGVEAVSGRFGLGVMVDHARMV